MAAFRRLLAWLAGAPGPDDRGAGVVTCPLCRDDARRFDRALEHDFRGVDDFAPGSFTR